MRFVASQPASSILPSSGAASKLAQIRAAVCYEPWDARGSRLVAIVGRTFTSGTGGYLVTLEPNADGTYTVVSSEPTGGI